MAGREQARSNRQAWLLSVVSGAFVLLTAITLASLFLWTPDQQTTNIIMWGRCVVSVGCSILLRVIGHQAAATTPSSLIPESSLDYQELARQIVPLLAHIWLRRRPLKAPRQASQPCCTSLPAAFTWPLIEQ